MSMLYKPGTDNLCQGYYIEVGPSGEELEDARKVYIDYGDRLPPTQEPGNLWKKVLF